MHLRVGAVRIRTSAARGVRSGSLPSLLEQADEDGYGVFFTGRLNQKINKNKNKRELQKISN